MEHSECVKCLKSRGSSPIPQEGKWIQSKEIKDICGFSHGCGKCAPQQGTCKLTINVKDGIIKEALVETIGCTGMTHSAAMAGEILIGKTLLEALNTDLVCDAINDAMKQVFLQLVYGRSQSAFSQGGLSVGSALEDLGKNLTSAVSTVYANDKIGPRYLNLTEGYITKLGLDNNNEIIGYEYVNLGNLMQMLENGTDFKLAKEKSTKRYGRFDDAVKYINPRKEWFMEKFNLGKKEKTVKQTLEKYNLKDLSTARKICEEYGIDIEQIVKGIQPICFDDAVWAYQLGCAIALTQKAKSAEEAAKLIGIGLQAFCLEGSVADERQIGLGHGNLASMLLSENTKCFCFLAGHESFAAAEGAMGIVKTANKVRKTPLKVILNGLGKDAAYIISRINGFTYVSTEYNYTTHTLKVLQEKAFSQGERKNVKVYGAYDVLEGVEIMKLENVDVSITGNSTNPVRFQHPVAGTYKKWCYDHNKTYFSVASGGGTGRTLHPDNVMAGPASYGLTDTMGRMHCDAQFAGSSSVPAHVEMMGFIGMGNNPIVGATVAIACKVSEVLNK